MLIASKFGLPVISFVDTAWLANTLDAEHRGLGYAIATATATMLEVQSPTIAVIVGEGGSEGALALVAADKILMMEYATLSPISPEGAAMLFYADFAGFADIAMTAIENRDKAEADHKRCDSKVGFGILCFAKPWYAGFAIEIHMCAWSPGLRIPP